MDQMRELSKRITNKKQTGEILKPRRTACAGPECLTSMNSAVDSEKIASVCGQYYYFCSEECYLCWLQKGILFGSARQMVEN